MTGVKKPIKDTFVPLTSVLAPFLTDVGAAHVDTLWIALRDAGVPSRRHLRFYELWTDKAIMDLLRRSRGDINQAEVAVYTELTSGDKGAVELHATDPHDVRRAFEAAIDNAFALLSDGRRRGNMEDFQAEMDFLRRVDRRVASHKFTLTGHPTHGIDRGVLVTRVQWSIGVKK